MNKFLHFGFKVKDIHASMKTYGALLDIKWDPVVEFQTEEQDLHGKPCPLRIYLTHGHTSDGTEIEMIQLLDGDVPDRIVLGDRDGISHVAYSVDDLEAARARAQAQGLKIVSEGKAGRANWIFVADDKLGGALVQFVKFNT
jgi:catechol 2,3-dioxygenase-like lactoylglutathione lyase family enzyme